MRLILLWPASHALGELTWPPQQRPFYFAFFSPYFFGGPLGAMSLKKPPAAPPESTGDRVERLVALLQFASNQISALEKVVAQTAAAQAVDRKAQTDRLTLVGLARVRHQEWGQKMEGLATAPQRERLRAFDNLWEQFDGDIMWVIESCQLSDTQAEKVGGLLLERRKKTPGPGRPDRENTLTFPAGEIGKRIEALRTQEQIWRYAGLRRDMDRDREAAEMARPGVSAGERGERGRNEEGGHPGRGGMGGGSPGGFSVTIG